MNAWSRKSIVGELKYFFLLVCIGLLGSELSAQSVKAYERAGDRAMERDEYYSAAQCYKDALKRKANDFSILYKYAEACRHENAFREADKAYTKIAGAKEAEQFPLLYFWSATVKKQLEDYEESEVLFAKYLEKDTTATGFYYKKAKQEILACQAAPSIIDDYTPLKIEWLENKINTPYSEFAPFLVNDSLYYSSMRFPVAEKGGKERYLAKLLLSEDLAEGELLAGFEKEEEHIANSTFTADGNRMYYTHCNGKSTSSITCAIYFSEKSEGAWGSGKKLGASINLENYTSTHPSIGFDSLQKQSYLFFASNRPGGEGKMDIWAAPINKNGECGKAVNLGPTINSIDDEVTPFYNEKTQTLFFSSNWHEGLGGYDIFYAKKEKENWLAPTNAGFPLNSSYNDVYYVLNRDNSMAFLSSNREGSLSLNEGEACCNDLYAVYLEEEEEEEEIPEEEMPVVVVPPKPKAPVSPVASDLPSTMTSTTPPQKARTLFKKLEEILPVTLYFHNDEPDSNTMAIATHQNYESHYFWYYSMKEKYKQEYARGNYVEAQKVDDFFELQVRKGDEDLNEFTELLLQTLMKGYKIKVSIKGYTSPRSPTRYNHHLAKRRISSARNFFRQYGKGILIPYLANNQVQFVEVPFGEVTSPPGISDSYQDPRNSIYSVEASRERRIEIVQVERYK